MREKVIELLKQKRDENYKEFNTKLIPGVDPAGVIGVRLPDIREVAKKLAKEDFREYIREIPEDCFYEETMIHGMVIGYAKISDEERFELIEGFVPRIDNWAVCDSVNSTYKFVEKCPGKTWEFLRKYLDSDDEFEARFAVTMIMDHFIKEEYIDKVIKELARICSRERPYYTMMAVAWAVSVCYVKFPQKTETLLRSGTLEDTAQNKSIQKIRESKRVSKEDKDRLLALKRKTPKQK